VNERGALVEEISRLSLQHWDKLKTPYLLSAMGPDLKYRGFDFQAIIKPLRLRQFIEYFLDDRLKVIADPNTPLKIGVVPNHVLEKKTPADLFKPTLNEARDGLYKLKPSIFSAFVSELPSDHKRYVDLKSNNYRYRDLPAAEIVGTDFVEIHRENIVSDFNSGTSKKDDLYQNFENWVAKNKLKKDDFIFEPGGVRQGHDLLSAMLQRLSDEELARVSIPLDIIKKLRGA
jgi:hypothetical protein